MRITSVQVYRYALPLTAPLFLSGRSLTEREGLLLEVRCGDKLGWGEGAPLEGFSRESIAQAYSDVLRLVPEVLEITSDGPEALTALYRSCDRLGVAPSVRFGFELAVSQLSGGLPARSSWRSIRVNALLAGTPEEMLRQTEMLREKGYSAVKMKVGRGDLDEEVRLVRGIAARLGRDVAIRVDANRAWSREETVAFWEGVRELPIQYFEEPLAEPAGLKELAHGGVPVAVDESLVSLHPSELARFGWARAAILKPTLLGGIARTQDFAREATRLGMTSVVSAAFESGIAMRALAALAGRLGETPAGLDTTRLFAGDPATPGFPAGVPRIERQFVEAPFRVDLRYLELLSTHDGREIHD